MTEEFAVKAEILKMSWDAISEVTGEDRDQVTTSRPVKSTLNEMGIVKSTQLNQFKEHLCRMITEDALRAISSILGRTADISTSEMTEIKTDTALDTMVELMHRKVKSAVDKQYPGGK